MDLYHTKSQATRNTIQRFAKVTDLDRLSFSIMKNRWTGMSNKAVILLSFLVAVASIGYTGMSVPIDAILTAINKRLGYQCSRATLFRALQELEKFGFISRSKYRVGNDRFATMIEFRDAMRFVSNKPSNMSYISPQVSKCDKALLTKTDHRVNSCDLSNIYKEPRGRASDSNLSSLQGIEPPPQKTPRKKRPKMHPAIYCAKVNTTGPDTKFILARVAFELAYGQGFPGHSGVPWEMYRWDEMTNLEKDALYRREILPKLRSKSHLETPAFEESLDTLLLSPTDPQTFPSVRHVACGGEPVPPASPLPERDGRGHLPEMTRAEIRAEILKLSSKYEPKDDVSAESLHIDPNDKDMQILIAARERVKRRQIAG